jgi:hypothetical protein
MAKGAKRVVTGIYVARQLGHDARLTLTRHGHVIDELEDIPRVEAESAIPSARLAVGTRGAAAVRDFSSRQARTGSAIDELRDGIDRRLAAARPTFEACRRTHLTTVKSTSSYWSRSCCAALVRCLRTMRW